MTRLERPGSSPPLLEDRLRVNGSDHPNTLTARYNLIRWRGEAGDPRALPDLRSLLSNRMRVFGTDPTRAGIGLDADADAPGETALATGSSSAGSDPYRRVRHAAISLTAQVQAALLREQLRVAAGGDQTAIRLLAELDAAQAEIGLRDAAAAARQQHIQRDHPIKVVSTKTEPAQVSRGAAWCGVVLAA